MYTLLSIYKYITYWRRKTRPHTREETQRRPAARPLGGAEVLVVVREPSPGGKKMELLLNPRMNMSSKASNCA